jgi:hypothetical protein
MCVNITFWGLNKYQLTCQETIKKTLHQIVTFMTKTLNDYVLCIVIFYQGHGQG